MKELYKYINIKKNPFEFEISDIIEIVLTPKKMRYFYLLNKLVGNHLEVKPNKIKAVGRIMAGLVYKEQFNSYLLSEYIKNDVEEIIEKELEKHIEPNEKNFIIGLAKSATAIGMATAEAIKDSYYISTIRETPIRIEPLFDFEESHTLLTNHRCYLKESSKLKNADRIIIVEDEITTGNTLVNLINKLVPLTNAKKINIVTILNFSNNEFTERLKKLEEKFNIKIRVNEIVKGELNYEELNDKILTLTNNDFNNKIDKIDKTDTIININKFNKISVQLDNEKQIEIIEKSGCFGISFKEIQQLEKQAKKVAEKIDKNYNKVLVIGHGENMYLPSRIAYYINKNADFKSTTQNKIIAKNISDYSIQQCSSFNVNDLEYYLYNRDNIEKEYDKVYFLVDSDINVKLTNNTEIVKI